MGYVLSIYLYTYCLCLLLCFSWEPTCVWCCPDVHHLSLDLSPVHGTSVGTCQPSQTDPPSCFSGSQAPLSWRMISCPWLHYQSRGLLWCSAQATTIWTQESEVSWETCPCNHFVALTFISQNIHWTKSWNKISNTFSIHTNGLFLSKFVQKWIKIHFSKHSPLPR